MSRGQARSSTTVGFASPRTQPGFSLIETLVALIVLSIGMLGIAALLTQGLGAARTALYRSAAVNLVAEMAERIRANRLAGAAYNAPGAANACGPGGGTACAPAELAAYDKLVWAALVARELPGGLGTVMFTPGKPPTYTITVSWHDAAGAAQYRIAPQISAL